MRHLVPILEFVHEVQAAGAASRAVDVLDAPQACWDALGPEARALLLSRRGLDPALADALRVRLVKRRGRALLAENVLLHLEPLEPPRFPRSLVARLPALLFEPLAGAPALGGADEFGGGASTEDDGADEARPSSWQGHLLALMDATWGGEPYDLAVDGPFVALPPSDAEIERYWVEEPFSLVAILDDEEAGERVYHVEEPALSGLERALLVTVNDRLRDGLLLDDAPVSGRAESLLARAFNLLRVYRFRTDRKTAYKLGYYLARNYLGSGRLDPLMRDPLLEDISCNGVGLPVFVAHSRHQTLRTNLSFDELALNTFTLKLAQRGGRLLSVAQPMVDATLPDGSRIQACFGREVTSRGSAFTVRKFREDPLTCVDLIRGGTHSSETMALLWLSVEMRASALVMGSTASGKTTTLNCLSQFIPPTLKIVTIEDTREITLQHENWLASVTRDSASAGGERVTMYHLLRAALRQRPEYILVGEVRGEEGLTLFQAMSTGHTCYSSMHAGSVENAVYRLENDPINVPRVMLTSLDLFLLQGLVEHKGRMVRRMLSLTELQGVDPQTRDLRLNEVFRWDAQTDSHVLVNASGFLDEARERRGWTRGRLDEELLARRRVLDGLVAREERHYRDVARALRRFHAERTVPLAVAGRSVPVRTEEAVP